MLSNPLLAENPTILTLLVGMLLPAEAQLQIPFVSGLGPTIQVGPFGKNNGRLVNQFHNRRSLVCSLSHRVAFGYALIPSFRVNFTKYIPIEAGLAAVFAEDPAGVSI